MMVPVQSRVQTFAEVLEVLIVNELCPVIGSRGDVHHDEVEGSQL